MTAPLLTKEEVAQRIGKSPRWVARAAGRGELGHVRVGRDLRFTEADIEAFIIASHRSPAVDPAQAVAESHGRITRGRSA